MSEEEKVENAQEEPEDQVNEEEMITEEVYDSISQAMGVISSLFCLNGFSK